MNSAIVYFGTLLNAPLHSADSFIRLTLVWCSPIVSTIRRCSIKPDRDPLGSGEVGELAKSDTPSCAVEADDHGDSRFAVRVKGETQFVVFRGGEHGEQFQLKCV